jgi:hypothetical protein
MKERILTCTKQHNRFLIILIGIIFLNAVVGFDIRFTIMNLLWILINIIKL